MKKLIQILLILPTLVACSTTQAVTPPMLQTGISALQSAKSQQQVTVTGRYTKWSGSCKGQPPISRGDWMLSDDHGCIYVHGQMPAVKIGTAVTIEGHIEVANDKRRYVELEHIVF